MTLALTSPESSTTATQLAAFAFDYLRGGAGPTACPPCVGVSGLEGISVGVILAVLATTFLCGYTSGILTSPFIDCVILGRALWKRLIAYLLSSLGPPDGGVGRGVPRPANLPEAGAYVGPNQHVPPARPTASSAWRARQGGTE
jgi:hypothetical protein